jgi:hypothetical protein
MPAWFSGAVVKAFLNWALGQILALVRLNTIDKADHEKNKSQAEQDTKKLKELKKDATAEETDKAIDDAFRNL